MLQIKWLENIKIARCVCLGISLLVVYLILSFMMNFIFDLGRTTFVQFVQSKGWYCYAIMWGEFSVFFITIRAYSNKNYYSKLAAALFFIALILFLIGVLVCAGKEGQYVSWASSEVSIDGGHGQGTSFVIDKMLTYDWLVVAGVFLFLSLLLSFALWIRRASEGAVMDGCSGNEMLLKNKLILLERVYAALGAFVIFAGVSILNLDQCVKLPLHFTIGAITQIVIGAFVLIAVIGFHKRISWAYKVLHAFSWFLLVAVLGIGVAWLLVFALDQMILLPNAVFMVGGFLVVMSIYLALMARLIDRIESPEILKAFQINRQGSV